MKYKTQREAIMGIVGAYVYDTDVDLIRNFRRTFPFYSGSDAGVLRQMLRMLFLQTQSALDDAKAHRIFLSQSLSAEVATKWRRPKVVEALKSLWFDGKNYRRITSCRAWGDPMTRTACRKHLRKLGLTGRPPPGETASDLAIALVTMRHNS
jgi:hypothetical protein